MHVHLEQPGLRTQALCDCGWQGKQRWTRASAVLDAGGHAAESGHLLMTNWERLARSLGVDRSDDLAADRLDSLAVTGS